MSPTEDPRPLRSAGEIRSEIEEEIAFHLERRIEDLLRRGLPEAAAREEAARQFGSFADTREICLKSDLRLERQRRRTAVTRGLWRDLRSGARLFRSQPGFALLAAGTITLGVAAATTVFSAVDHVLLRPLPYRDPDSVVVLREQDLRTGADMEVSAGNLLSWRSQTRSFAAMGMAEPSGLDLTSVDPPEPLASWSVTPGFREALGVEPLRGRGFVEGDFLPGAPGVVLISHRLWMQRFGGEPAILGKVIGLDGSPATIVGVLPPAQPHPQGKDLWVPRPFTAEDAEDRNGQYREGVARLRPGVSREEAQADLDRAAAHLATEHPRTNQGRSVRAVALSEHVLGSVRPGLTVLFGAALLLLLVSCANVSGLLFARGVGRERELAVHLALGASRAQLARKLLTEGIVLAAAGGAVGLLLSFAGADAVRALAPPELPRIETLAIDARSALFAVSVAAVAALLAGLAPAVRLSRRSAADCLRGASMGAVSERVGQAWRRRLVVAEVATALVLLCGATLLGQSLARLLSNSLGFAPERLASIQLFLWDRNPTPEQCLARAEAIRARLAAAPGVEAVGIVTAQPFHPTQIDATGVFLIAGRPVSPTERPPRVFSTIASPEYFGVMEIPLRRGRGFAGTDIASSPAVAVINETLARRAFPDEDPVGKRVKVSVMGPPVEREIVGVVGDVRPTSFDSRPRPEVYVPLAQTGNGSLTFVVKTSGRPETVMPTLRAAVSEVDRGQSVYFAGPVEEMVRATTRERRFVLALTTATAALALALTAIGVAGLFAYTTRRRRREFGIRIALGARRSQVAGLVLSEAARLGGIGVALGLAASLAANRSLSALLYEVRPTDVRALALAASVLLILAVLGAALPAWKAAGTPPATTLRQD